MATQNDDETHVPEIRIQYKRRKTTPKFDEDLSTKPNDKLDEVNLSMKNSRDIILEQMCQSMENDPGLVKCIKSATALGPGIYSTTEVEDSVTYDGSADDQSRGKETELCLATFFDIIMSEKFAQLCSLLLKDFPGFKADTLFDLGRISSMMKNNVYESSPDQFPSDIQQIWDNLQQVGTAMTVYANYMSSTTSSAYRAQRLKADTSAHIIPESTIHEEVSMQLPETSSVTGVLPCSLCGEESTASKRLVCDSCEELYHFSCIVPIVTEAPSGSWYCATCSATDSV